MHKRTKALSISEAVKDKVWERDEGQCIACRYMGKTGWQAYPEAHFIPRSKSGLGVEENILTLCRPHHYQYDNGSRNQREKMRNLFRIYLMNKYPEWDEKKLYYHKEAKR